MLNWGRILRDILRLRRRRKPLNQGDTFKAKRCHPDGKILVPGCEWEGWRIVEIRGHGPTELFYILERW